MLKLVMEKIPIVSTIYDGLIMIQDWMDQIAVLRPNWPLSDFWTKMAVRPVANLKIRHPEFLLLIRLFFYNFLD